jgi:aerobic carbon-monoxide dehydrogenase large subunit
MENGRPDCPEGAMTDSGPYIGRPMKRVEDPKLVTGSGLYVDDVKLPGLAHLAFVRSPHAHARVTSLSIEGARHRPGTIAVLTAKDLEALRPLPLAVTVANLRVPPSPTIAGRVVKAVGMPVAAVLAETPALARDAADCVAVEYEPLPAVADPEAALRPGAPLVHPELGTNEAFRITTEGGDVSAALSEGTHTVRVRVAHPRLAAAPIEPRAVLAWCDPETGNLTVWLTTQTPFSARRDLSTLLDYPEAKIRVIAPDIGGSFGVKQVYGEDVVAAVLALRTGRPVKWAATRTEDFMTTTQGRGAIDEAEATVTPDGRVTALRVRIIHNMGADLKGYSLVPVLRHSTLVPGAYRIPNVEVTATGAFTNAAPTGPYRGAGRPEAAFLIERVMDEAARVAGLDPAEIRRRNFVPPEAFPYRTATGLVYDSGNYAQSLAKVLELADYEGLRREQAEARERGALMGIGLSTYVEPSGGAGWESGVVRVEPTGQVTAVTGSSPHGQGLETTFAQIVADYLGVRFEDVTVRHGDTHGVPLGIGTFGSRSAALGGSALVEAATEVREKGRRLAAVLLEASLEDIEPVRSGFQVKGAPDRKVTWAGIANFAYGMMIPPSETPGLEATVVYRQEQEMFSFGACIAVVRIDRESGRLRLERIIGVDDCGNVINPLLASGQFAGASAQGIGQALFERLVYDEGGQLLTGTFMDYAIPRADDMPEIVVQNTVTPTPLNPLGAKGIGEAGTVAVPPAVVNAAFDALAGFGIRRVDMPLTPDRIWHGIHCQAS